MQIVGTRRSIPRILSMILAGGEGKRLAPLTLERAKPARDVAPVVGFENILTRRLR